MKIKIFRSISKNGRPYWSISASNSKNPSDKGTYFVSFGRDCTEPTPQKGTSKNGKEYEYADIDVLDMSFGWYNGAPSLWINKCTQPGVIAEKFEEKKPNEQLQIDSDALPFY